MGNSFCAEWVVERFESAFCVIEVSQIIIHKTDQPKPVFHLLDTDALACKDLAEIDLAGIEADWTCPQLIPHPVLIQADNRSNLTGNVPPIAECLRRVL
jgi:hypothetical protein